MMRQSRIAAAVAWAILLSCPAFAEVIGSGHVMGNGTNSAAAPTDTSLINILNQSGSGLSRAGTSSTLATVVGTIANGHCRSTDSNGNDIDAGGPCTIGGGGGTVSPATAGQIAYYQSTGSTVVGSNLGTGVFTSLGNAVNLVSGLVTQDSSGRIFNDQGQGNWLQTYMNNSVVGSYGYNNMGVFLGAGGSNGQGGVSGAARTSTVTSVGGAIAISGFAFNDGGTKPDDPSFAGYTECRAYALGVGGTAPTGDCAGFEIDITNFRASPVVTLPYNAGADGSTFGMHIASGGACSASQGFCYNPDTGTLNLAATQSSAALMIGPNGSSFNQGIVFGCNGIGTTDCAGGGAGTAISLYTGLSAVWYAPSNTQTFQIASTATSGTGSIVFSNSGLSIASNTGLSINGTAGATCGPGAPSGIFQVIDGIVVHC